MIAPQEAPAGLRASLLALAAERGGDAPPDETVTQVLPEETVPGWWVFRVSWPSDAGQQAVTGVAEGDTVVEARPNRALGKVFQRWRSGGDPPGALETAAVSAFVLGGAGPHQLVADPDDIERLVRRAEWRPHVTPPRTVEVDGQPGVAFWWVYRGHLSRMAVWADGDDRVDSETHDILEVVHGTDDDDEDEEDGDEDEDG